MTYGFGAFFNLLPGGDVSSLLLIYGFPITVGGGAATAAAAIACLGYACGFPAVARSCWLPPASALNRSCPITRGPLGAGSSLLSRPWRC